MSEPKVDLSAWLEWALLDGPDPRPAPVAPKVCPTCSDLRVLVGPNPDHDPLDRRSPTDLVVPCPSCSAEKGAEA